MQFRPYQFDFENDVYTAWQTARNVLGVMPTGGGKTPVVANIITKHTGMSCAIAHRRELVAQLSTRLALCGLRHKIIAPNNIIKWIIQLHVEETGRSYYDPNSYCTVASVDTINSRKDKIKDWLQNTSLWVVDECFPAGTLVDYKPIETIQIGDYVTAFNEKTKEFSKQKVIRVFKKLAPEQLITLNTINNHNVVCTLNHPFYTKRGWVDAGKLLQNDEVLIHESKTSSNLHNVRKYSRSIRVPVKPVGKNRSGILQRGMLKQISPKSIIRNYGKNKQKICLRTYEKKKSHAQHRYPQQSKTNINRYEAQTPYTRWEWKTPYKSRDKIIRAVRNLRIHSTIYINYRARGQGHRLPESLQNRLWKPHIKNSYRSRWEQSQYNNRKRTRCTKRTISYWSKLESTSISKRNDTKQPTESYVYNIEVDKNHTYVANNIVVHNCHHIVRRNKWGKAIDLFPNARGLGVTATPCRADGLGLGRHADGVFDVLVESVGMRELIRIGYLSDYRIFAPPSDLCMDDEKVGKAGDWSRQQLKQRAQKSHIVGDVVAHYLRIAPGKLGLTFATDVETATGIAMKFKQAGVPAEVVSANTPDKIRVELLRRFERREILQLVNVDLYGEGVDVPGIEVVSMARPTESFSLYRQQFGRGTRPLEGKEYVIVIDHVDNVKRHGLPDANRVWTLDRRERRTAKKSGIIPVRTCLKCTAVYEAIYSQCPYCGFEHVPAERSKPEYVEGDLTELDPKTLATMRGEIDRIDAPESILWTKLDKAGFSKAALMGATKNHRLRQEAQNILRNSIAWWAGHHQDKGRTIRECMKLFYFTFGIDVMTAQTLGRPDAEKLSISINKNIDEIINMR